MNELDLFAAAIAIADPGERAAFLDRQCGDQPDLRQRIAQLLDAHFQSNPLLDPTNLNQLRNQVAPANVTSDFPNQREQLGGVIAGKYTLVELVGEGGMGSVWRAKQTEPVKRVVAVKLIKAGMDSKQVLARFEAERQALALMDHPNIAKVLDGGLHQHRPYFVMELVKGVPITNYCDAHKLVPKERLELFVPVCQAIQHAHQKGIIHRDIKPSNVLVAMYDDKPVVKVIDFGVAKATGGELTESTIDTGFGAVVGTPQYMSPEQATFNNVDIDTRTDVYALGVLLYELLTGSTPFSQKELEKRGLLEMLRVVREEEPPRPSTKLSSADALPTLSANRGTEPKKLTGLLKNELDWIVMKALEKDRTRRYETANGFAADVLRYLGGEAVQAHPPSAGYRLKKFLRRKKGPVLAASLVFLALLAGVIGTTIGMVRAANLAKLERLAKLDAEAQKANALDSAAAEKQANEQAQKRLVQIEKGNEIITSIFNDLDIRAVKEGTEPLEAVLAQRLVKAAEQLEGEAVGDPLMVAGLQNRLGESLLGLGHPQAAIALLVKSRETRMAKLGTDHPDTLMSMNNLAGGYHASGKLDLALPLLEETLKLRTAKLGADHPDTLQSMGNLANAYKVAGKLALALPLYEETLKLCKAKLGVDNPDTLMSMNNLAEGYRAVGKLDLALPLWEETMKLTKAKLGADHPHTLTSMGNLASGFMDVGMRDLALPLFEQTLAAVKAKLGVDHPSTLLSMGNLASGYMAAGKPDLALPLFEETLKFKKAKLGADHPDTLNSMNGLAMGYKAIDKLALALPLFEETLKLRKSKLGADHPSTLFSMNNLAAGYDAVGKRDLALQIWEETLKLRKAKLGADHPDTLTSMNNLAFGYEAVGKRDLALPLHEETLKLKKAKLGADHSETLTSMGNLGNGYRAAGKLDQALPLLEETLKLVRTKLGADHSYALTSMNNLALGYQDAGKLDLALPLFQEAVASIEKLRFQHLHAGLIVPNLIACHEQLKQFDQAETWRRKWLAVVKERSGADSAAYAVELALLGSNLLQLQKWTESESVLRECRDIREKIEPDSWTTFNTQSMLGAALQGQRKYAEAEPLLLAGYEGMKKPTKTIPASSAKRLLVALDRLIEVYTMLEKPDEVTKWQAERAKNLAEETTEKK